MAEITITTQNFAEEVENADLPVLIDFWATWCGPCMMMAPIVEEYAKEKAGVIKVGKVNVDEEPSLAMRFHIASIPTLMLFKGGAEVGKTIGYQEKAELDAFVNASL